MRMPHPSNRCRVGLVAVLISLGLPWIGACAARAADGVKGAFVDGFTNEQAAFFVRVSVDHEDCEYQAGETLTATVRSARPGYLYLFYFMADGTVSCLFPNSFQPDHYIQANVDVVVPSPQDKFRIRIGAPFGKEVLKAVVSREPLRALEIQKLTDFEMPQVRIQAIHDAYTEQLKDKANAWSVDDVWIETVGPARGLQARPSEEGVHGGGRRVGVFIGVQVFQDRRIRRLSCPAQDAQKMDQAMRALCGLNDTYVLINEQATLNNIRSTICQKVAQATRPGDTVILYLSTHGSRCSDDNGDEEDGYDEFLAVYDTNLDNLATIRASVLMDDAFGVWLQKLDGRRVIVIADTCHSGGQYRREKSPNGADTLRFAKGFDYEDAAPVGDFDFLDGELQGIKDIGQREVAMLAAARAAQIAFERRDGNCSVMTYYLLQLLEDQPQLTLTQAYQHLVKEVPEYVEGHFPGTTQTPVLYNELDGVFRFRP